MTGGEEVQTALIKVSVTGARFGVSDLFRSSFSRSLPCFFFFLFYTFKALLVAVPLQRNKGDSSPGPSLLLPAYRSPSYLPPLRASPSACCPPRPPRMLSPSSPYQRAPPLSSLLFVSPSPPPLCQLNRPTLSAYLPVRPCWSQMWDATRNNGRICLLWKEGERVGFSVRDFHKT